MGFTIEDERVRKAFEYSMTYQWSNGLFTRFRASQEKEHRLQNENAPCDLGVYLTGLGKTSGGDIAPIEKSYKLLVDFQVTDNCT